MNHDWVNTIIAFFVILFLQLFLFNIIYLGVYINLFPYVLFLLLIPASFSPLVVLLLSALMGFTIDVFSSGAVGIHLAACSAVGYFRTHVFTRIISSEKNEAVIPLAGQASFRDYILYTGILLFIHHFVLLVLDVFDVGQYLYFLIRFTASFFVNLAIISLMEMLIRKK